MKPVPSLVVEKMDSQQGMHSEALLKSCVAKHKELGDNHPDTITSFHKLADLYADQGMYSEAEVLYKLCVEKRRAVLGENHPDTIRSINNLAILNCDQDKSSEAVVLFKSCVAKHKELGDNHPDTITSFQNLADLYSDQGKSSEAEVLYKSCVEKRKAVLGENHPDTISSFHSLAILYADQGKYSEAEVLYKSCVTKYKAVLGDNHPDTITTIHNLGILYSEQGKYSEAEVMYKSCAAKANEVLGEDHPDTIRSMFSLAVVYLAQSNTSAAKPLLQTLATTTPADNPLASHVSKLLSSLDDNCPASSINVGCYSFALGTKVRMVGLKSRSDLNDQVGEIVSMDAHTADTNHTMRALVKLSGGAQELIKVRLENMQQVDVAVSVMGDETVTTMQNTATTTATTTRVSTIEKRGIVVGFESDSARYRVRFMIAGGGGATKSVEVWQVFFEPGTLVRVHGLESETGKRHNNKVGNIASYDASKRRYAVQFQDGTELAVKADNLRL